MIIEYPASIARKAAEIGGRCFTKIKSGEPLVECIAEVDRELGKYCQEAALRWFKENSPRKTRAEEVNAYASTK